MIHFHVLSTIKDHSGLTVTKWRIFLTVPAERIAVYECNRKHEDGWNDNIADVAAFS